MEKINIGQRFVTNRDVQTTLAISGKQETLPKGSVLFTSADKRFFCMPNGKMWPIREGEYEVADGFSVSGIAEWIYQKISCAWCIDKMIEEQADWDETGIPEQVERFKRDIGDALEELGFYDYTGNTL